MLIYKATNKINGKEYVGQTVKSLKQRKQKHFFDATKQRDNYYFHCALRKYGIKNFNWEIIHDNISNIEELNKLEIYYIGLYNTFEKGYNLTFGGASILGFKHSEESKKRMSEAHKGEKSYWYGRKHTEESKRKMSEKNKGKRRSEETRKKLSIINSGKNNSMYGKHRSEEVKRKISKSLSGKNHSFYGKHFSKELCRKMSEARKGEKNHFYGKHHTVEARKKMSEARIGKHIGKGGPRAKAVIANGSHFDTVNEAAKFVGISSTGVRKRILHKTKWLDYHYACKEEN